MTDFKAKDFRFHEQNFPGFRILEAEILGFRKFGWPYMEKNTTRGDEYRP